MPTLIDLALGRQDVPPPEQFGGTLEAFPFELWDQVLNDHVDDKGEVNYQTAQPTQILIYIDTLSRVAPETHPDFFPDERFRLAYYINAYNAFTRFTVSSKNPESTRFKTSKQGARRNYKEDRIFLFLRNGQALDQSLRP